MSNSSLVYQMKLILIISQLLMKRKIGNVSNNYLKYACTSPFYKWYKIFYHSTCEEIQKGS